MEGAVKEARNKNRIYVNQYIWWHWGQVTGLKLQKETCHRMCPRNGRYESSIMWVGWGQWNRWVRAPHFSVFHLQGWKIMDLVVDWLRRTISAPSVWEGWLSLQLTAGPPKIPSLKIKRGSCSLTWLLTLALTPGVTAELCIAGFFSFIFYAT